MGVKKIAVSLPQELVEAARSAAEEEGQSLSGWLAEAAGDRLRLKNAARALEAFEAEHGEIREEELEEVRRLWPV